MKEKITGPKDELFAAPRTAQDFSCGGLTAQVFDDMVNRPAIRHAELQNMMTELSCDFTTPGSTVLTGGCSMGTTLLKLDHRLEPDIRLMGLDNAADMLALARNNVKADRRPIGFVLADRKEPLLLEQVSVVLSSAHDATPFPRRIRGTGGLFHPHGGHADELLDALGVLCGLAGQALRALEERTCWLDSAIPTGPQRGWWERIGDSWRYD